MDRDRGPRAAHLPSLLAERVDIGRDVLRLPARQHHIHPRVRIENREGKHLGIGSKFSRDHLERRRISHISALAWRHDMACDTARFGDTFAVIGVGGERR